MIRIAGLLLLFLIVCSKNGAYALQEFIATEKDGMLVVEAEAFVEQEKNDIRQWYIVTPDSPAHDMVDGDPAHAETASASAYVEILPDTRRTHDDKLIHGENFSNTPGMVAILHYPVNITTPGRYYIWVRAYSTGTEDNGIHVGMNGTWPESGQRMQWCDGKQAWRWESKQRTEEVHCGVPYLIYLDIDEPGVYDIQFSMREDGFEFDQWLMTTDRDFTPEGYPVREE